MAIVPDDKDWTWVLERACPECGFDPAEIGYREIPAATRGAVRRWVAWLTGSPIGGRAGDDPLDGTRPVPDLRARPDGSSWSPLEYGAHVRDVCRIMLARLNLMLVLDHPDFANWDQDETACSQSYGDQDPAIVAVELSAAGEALARAIELVPDSALDRTGQRSNGSRFTVETLASYFLHDLLHHTWDVGG